MNWRGLNFRLIDESRFNIFFTLSVPEHPFWSLFKGNNIYFATPTAGIYFLSGLAYGSLEKDLFCQMKRCEMLR